MKSICLLHEQALGSRSELVALRKGEELQRLNVINAKAGYKPTVQLFAVMGGITRNTLRPLSWITIFMAGTRVGANELGYFRRNVDSRKSHSGQGALRKSQKPMWWMKDARLSCKSARPIPILWERVKFLDSQKNRASRSRGSPA